MPYDLPPLPTERHGVTYHCGLTRNQTIYVYPQEGGMNPRLPPELSSQSARKLAGLLVSLANILDGEES